MKQPEPIAMWVDEVPVDVAKIARDRARLEAKVRAAARRGKPNKPDRDRAKSKAARASRKRNRS